MRAEGMNEVGSEEWKTNERVGPCDTPTLMRGTIKRKAAWIIYYLNYIINTCINAE